jgi:hypothetical protein
MAKAAEIHSRPFHRSAKGRKFTIADLAVSHAGQIKTGAPSRKTSREEYNSCCVSKKNSVMWRCILEKSILLCKITTSKKHIADLYACVFWGGKLILFIFLYNRLKVLY